MLIESIAQRYARALFSTALAQKTADTIGHELAGLVESFRKDPVKILWISTRVPEQEKKTRIERSFSGLSTLMLHFLFLLIDKRREQLLEKSFEAYQKLLLDFYNQCVVEVSAASRVPDGVQTELKERLSQRFGKRIDLKITVNPSLLGGMVIRIGDRVVDGSLRAKLDGLHEELLRAR